MAITIRVLETFLVILCLIHNICEGWIATTNKFSQLHAIHSTKFLSTVVGRQTKSWERFLSDNGEDVQENPQRPDDDDDDDTIQRTNFYQAGQSLTDQEEKKRLDLMGDYDLPGYQNDSAERVRAAIRERTAGLGIKKSQATADYIRMKEEAAKAAGPGGQSNPNIFGGLDLSQISDTKLKESGKSSNWDEDMPSMFYDPEKELSKEEQEKADPLMTKSIIEQFTYELSQSRFPTPMEALRQVGVMIVVVGFSTLLIYVWDNLLRELYQYVGFVPSEQDLANYASRFEGLDLPDSWADGFDATRIKELSESADVGLSTSPPVEGGLPEL
ncbi:hypothetical protein ACA910_018174 [Epithemia clementina (nom. ined.)]